MADETTLTQAPVNQTIARAPAAPAAKQGATSTLITNPAPANPPPVAEAAPTELPASTLLEMEAGRKALERNKPVNVRADRIRAENEAAQNKSA